MNQSKHALEDAEYGPAKTAKIVTSQPEVASSDVIVPHGAAALTDLPLMKIFQQLGPVDRLRASEVCTNWANIARAPWAEITRLDLTGIPAENIGAVLGHCPNLKSLSGHQTTIFLRDVRERFEDNRLGRLESVEFCDVVFACGQAGSVPVDMFGYDKTPQLRELALHNIVNKTYYYYCYSVSTGTFTAHARSEFTSTIGLRLDVSSLRRLQLSGTHPIAIRELIESLCSLKNLESLMLADEFSLGIARSPDIQRVFASAIEQMKKLRELSLINVFVGNTWRGRFSRFLLSKLYRRLANLEVLILVEDRVPVYKEILQDLLHKNWMLHPSLRVLVIAANSFGGHSSDGGLAVSLPERPLQSKAGATLPFLNVFVGGDAAAHLWFKSSGNAHILPILLPMPQFLANAAIQPIFDGVWAADVISNMSSRSSRLWNYDGIKANSIIFE